MAKYQTDIIIVNYNTKEYLADCLQSIDSFSGNTGNYQVWVVDNASTDGSADLIQKYGKFVSGIYNPENRGYGRACNQGISAGVGDHIFFLNSDTLVTAGWLPPLIKALNSSEVAVVGPRLINPEGLLVGVGVVGTNAHPFIRGWNEPNEPACYNQSIQVLSVGGACMGIKRELIPKLGLFDEHYFHYFEETDYCYNARFHGYQVIYCPESTVIHRVNGSCQDFQRLRIYYREGEKYFQKKWKSFLKDTTKYG
ncbi:MAG TPA: glycosyltransferase family 2 protein [Firmicutes bacterium]|jgi:GT2 family glycosyltransferase|nr:glycosyltransferase family 2 protein [Bacillota bacterium]